VRTGAASVVGDAGEYRAAGGSGSDGQAPGAGEFESLFVEFAGLPEDDSRRRGLRDRLVTEYLPVAEHIARRFAHRGEPPEDLVQVATVGLIKAVDRFDPRRGADFLSFAVPTITGEVRRYFRDCTWAVRVPRRLKVLHVEIRSATTELVQRLGRAPTPSELAGHLAVAKEEVYEALQASNAYNSSSLNEMLLEDSEPSMTLGDTLGGEDGNLAGVENREALRPLLARLPDRERYILGLRFFGNLTQTQIAERVGLSQMHVSRLLTKALGQLREDLLHDPRRGVAPPDRTRAATPHARTVLSRDAPAAATAVSTAPAGGRTP
jgi:RNA polymerase sigma-B factor